ncbi:apolipoprotein N-acyltransferase [Chelatococcus asaccharovorans]|uniref:Apolipoprotein N-acyltransferase n=1 Tax=Chelatococcus asaccharovorans TaxID=28210 RepID=A0A2V3U6R8_9HYPH|nr:apolipoprotein N-acyltransferase [Chelatococcus asaccharovorans]MBS7705879.1 apolipoprotein N-acyltransferase [Chelatococcus asaccharovorans]PXW58901.1 apolipoprotein N-acyltransferase [Chelatococcus asaccharovorans]
MIPAAVSAVASRVATTRGWPRRGAAWIAGALGALAMPPVGLWPVLILSLITAVWLLDGRAGRGETYWRSVRSAAWDGWWFGFGYFVAGLWWLGAAFFVQADEFLWALPLGVLGLPAGLAIFFAGGFALARALWAPGATRIVTLAAALTLAEWLRGHILTGFPWNVLGMALAQGPEIAATPIMGQIASIIGLWGLTFVAVACLASPATLADPGPLDRRIAAPLAALLTLAAIGAFGLARIPQQDVATVPGVVLRIMQPNVPQDEKFRRDRAQAILDHYFAVTRRPVDAALGEPTHVIWPESAFPFLLEREPAALAQIGAVLGPDRILVTGAARADDRLPGENYRIYNSIQVVDGQGTLRATYDKVHLVPFGEYLPFGGLLERFGLRQFVEVPGTFAAGDRSAPLAIPGLPETAPLICYEAIFPEDVIPVGTRPALLLNVTNDAWFGLTAGPYQHFAQARLRAIEQGLPLVRAANTGISAVVDPYGRITASLGLGQEGVIDARLPVALPSTPYAQFGNVFVAFPLIWCAAILIFSLARRPVRRDR